MTKGQNEFRNQKKEKLKPFLKNNVAYLVSVQEEFFSGQFSIETMNKIEELATQTDATIEFVRDLLIDELQRIKRAEKRRLNTKHKK